MNRDEFLRMQLAGTVTFPATFPQLGRMKLRYEHVPAAGGEKELILEVTETPSVRVELTRRVSVRHVRAIFLPRDTCQVNYSDGVWLVGSEIAESGIPLGYECGIAFVSEDAPSLLEVSAGMTAAESVQYYPPLPNDTSRNHYNAWSENLEACSFLRECC